MVPRWTILILSTVCKTPSSVPKYVFHNVSTSSLHADATCLDAYNTHLASIHSEEDNADAQALCAPQPGDDRPGCWIGLHDFHREAGGNGDEFIWYDATPLDYKNWRPGEPNNYYGHSGGEDLVNILAESGQWNDELNGRRMRLICWNPDYTKDPTNAPTLSPSSSPTTSPTNEPTTAPTAAPTVNPTPAPTAIPTTNPTDAPTNAPTFAPTFRPTLDREVQEEETSTASIATNGGEAAKDDKTPSAFVESNSTTIVYVLSVLLFITCVLMVVLCYTELKRVKGDGGNGGDLREALLDDTSNQNVTLPHSYSMIYCECAEGVELTKPSLLINHTLSSIVNNTAPIGSSEDEDDVDNGSSSDSLYEYVGSPSKETPQGTKKEINNAHEHILETPMKHNGNSANNIDTTTGK